MPGVRPLGLPLSESCFILPRNAGEFVAIIVFASINHDILKGILKEYISDKDILWLLDRVIDSFEVKSGIGLPLGNLTSQLLVNIYMNKFDQFIKHKLKAGYYIRYADDFIILSENKDWLENLLLYIRAFFYKEMALELHPKKVFIKTLVSGVNFLGWVNFPDHRILRTVTKRRMLKRIVDHPASETINSYLGLLGHGNTYKLKKLF